MSPQLSNRRLMDFRFRRQQVIDRNIADFVCCSARSVIEADGTQHAQSSRDSARDTYLQSRGFRVLRIWNDDILARPDAVWAAPNEARS